MVDLLKQNWSWISANPWAFVSFASLFVGIGWAAAAAFYHERIKLLEAGQGKKQGNRVHGRSEFIYREFGRHGRNILSNKTYDVRAGDSVSVQIEIPDGQTAQIVLRGPPAKGTGNIGAWDFNVVGVTNWVPSRYEENETRSKQLFSAEAGKADMELHFRVAGKVSIQMLKGASHKPDWVKSLCVHEAG